MTQSSFKSSCELEVKLDRSWYPKQFEVYDWLKKNIGPIHGGNITIHQIFGYTHIKFNNQTDHDKFIEYLRS